MKNYLKNVIAILILFLNGFLFAQTSLEEAQSAYDQGHEYYLAGNADSAKILFTEAIKLYQELGKEADTLLADSYHNLGQVQFDNRETDEAMNFVRKGLNIKKKALPPDHPSLGLSYRVIGDIYLDLGKYDSSQFYYELALPIIEKDSTNNKSKALLYNNLGSLYQDLGDYEKAVEYHLIVLEIRNKLFDNESVEVAGSYNNLANAYLDMGQYDLAMNYYKKALAMKQKVLPEGHASLASSYSNLGAGYQMFGEDQKALENYELALEIRKKIFPKNHPYLGRSYFNIGSMYLNLAEDEKALQTFEQCVQIWEESLGPDNIYTSMGYHGLALTLIDLGRYEEALSYAKKSIVINLATFGKAHPSIPQIYETIAECHYRLENYEEAMSIHEESMKIQVGILGPNHTFIATIYQNMAEVYMAKGALPDAAAYFEKAIEIEERNFGTKHPNLSYSYLNLANIYTKLNQCEDNLVYYQKSLEANFNDFTSKSKYDLPSLDLEAMDYAKLLETIADKAKALEKCGNGDEASLRNIAQTYERAIDFLDKVMASFRSEEGVLALQERSREIYEGGIRAYLELFEQDHNPEYQEKAFLFAEKGKAARFNQLLRASNARQYTGVPQEFLAYEEQVRKRITFYEKELLEYGGEMDSVEIQQIKDQIFDLTQSYDSVIKVMKNDYQDYYQLVFKPEVASRQDVVRTLPKNGGLIEYFLGEKYLYAFYISKDFFATHSLALPEPDKIFQLRESIYSYYTGLDSMIQTIARSSQNEIWRELARDFYHRLIGNSIEKLPERLTIIPDGEIGYLPFEVLLDKDGEYLIEKSALSYAYSATHLLESQAKKKNASQRLLAFSPSFKENKTLFADANAVRRSYLGPLFYSQQEVEAIQQIMGGKTIMGENATLGEFLSQASDYQIIHISSHGKVNDLYPELSFIAFSSESDSIITDGEPFYGVSGLYLADLYNLKLNADMVVLSACETGVGKLAKAEGIISLARGFAFAGASSIVTTLWSVNDKTSADLMEAYYQNLSLGQAKDIALQNAKKAFIDENESPFFWAGYVVIGDPGPLSNNNAFWFLLAGGFLFLLVGGFFLRRIIISNRA